MCKESFDAHGHVEQVFCCFDMLRQLSPQEHVDAIQLCRDQMWLKAVSTDGTPCGFALAGDLYLHSDELQQLLSQSTFECRFVDPTYLGELWLSLSESDKLLAALLEEGDTQRDEILETLKEVGASVAPRLELQYTHQVHWKSGRNDFNWEHTVDKYDVSEYMCSVELQDLISCSSTITHRQLLEIMDTHWLEYYVGKLYWKVTRYQGAHYNGGIDGGVEEEEGRAKEGKFRLQAHHKSCKHLNLHV